MLIVEANCVTIHHIVPKPTHKTTNRQSEQENVRHGLEKFDLEENGGK